MDYEGVFQKHVQFEGGQSFAVIDILILDDNLTEGAETFSGELVVTGPNQTVPPMIEIEILDDDSKPNKIWYLQHCLRQVFHH